jgi:hypothetical protein
MTRLWPAGTPLQVITTEQGRPLRLIWQQHTHTIAAIVQEWEVDTDWWEPSGRSWCLYYATLTEDGLLCVFYQDLVDGAWYLSKLYD